MAKLPEEEIRQLENELTNLHVQLDSDYSELGDWVVVKSYEYFLAHQEIPYDFDDLHAKREAIRVRIREIEEILKNAEPIESEE